MNKKAEVRLSSFVMGIVLILGSVMLISLLVVEMANTYNVRQIDHFETYEDIYLETNQTIKEIIRSQDEIEEEPGNITEGTFQQLISPVTGAVDQVSDFWEGSLVRKAWLSIQLFPRMFSSFNKLIKTSLENSGLPIPSVVIWLIYSLIGVWLVVLIVRALWEKKS
jgi:hypothetical protein